MLKNYFCHAVFYSLINHFYYVQQCAMLQFFLKTCTWIQHEKKKHYIKSKAIKSTFIFLKPVYLIILIHKNIFHSALSIMSLKWAFHIFPNPIY